MPWNASLNTSGSSLKRRKGRCATALARTRRLGKNAENGAVAILAMHQKRVLIAILQDESCLTVLTWPQFEPRMHEFGRTHLPRRRGRMLRRLMEPEGHPGPETA